METPIDRRPGAFPFPLVVSNNVPNGLSAECGKKISFSEREEGNADILAVSPGISKYVFPLKGTSERLRTVLGLPIAGSDSVVMRLSVFMNPPALRVLNCLLFLAGIGLILFESTQIRIIEVNSELRIPVISATDSGGSRPPDPEDVGRLPERSDAGVYGFRMMAGIKSTGRPFFSWTLPSF
jgi:hypothetical protein